MEYTPLLVVDLDGTIRHEIAPDGKILGPGLFDHDVARYLVVEGLFNKKVFDGILTPIYAVFMGDEPNRVQTERGLLDCRNIVTPKTANLLRRIYEFEGTKFAHDELTEVYAENFSLGLRGQDRDDVDRKVSEWVKHPENHKLVEYELTVMQTYREFGVPVILLSAADETGLIPIRREVLCYHVDRAMGSRSAISQLNRYTGRIAKNLAKSGEKLSAIKRLCHEMEQEGVRVVKIYTRGDSHGDLFQSGTDIPVHATIVGPSVQTVAESYDATRQVRHKSLEEELQAIRERLTLESKMPGERKTVQKVLKDVFHDLFVRKPPGNGSNGY